MKALGVLQSVLALGMAFLLFYSIIHENWWGTALFGAAFWCYAHDAAQTLKKAQRSESE